MREIITRGDLPHWYVPGAAHFVTYRLADSIPIEVLGRMKSEREMRVLRLDKCADGGSSERQKAHKQFFAAYDRYIDQGLAQRWLEEAAVAKIIIDNLYHHHQIKYQLLEYTVMPNHVHVLMVPIESDASSFRHVQEPAFQSDEILDSQSPLTEIMHSLKSFTANEANKHLGRSGRFWQRESYDHWVRDDGELSRIAEYIVQNPVNAGLVKNTDDWPYGSVRDRKHGSPKVLPQWW